jgi:Na+-transporting NADH:ubiquinone oxidoreductase subunit NqrB
MRLGFVVVCSIVGTSEIIDRGNVVVGFLILSLGYCLVLGLCCFQSILGIDHT